MNVRIPHVTNTHIHRAHPHLPACSHHPPWPSSLALSPVLPSIPIGLEATPASVVMRIAFARPLATASDGAPYDQFEDRRRYRAYMWVWATRCGEYASRKEHMSEECEPTAAQIQAGRAQLDIVDA